MVEIREVAWVDADAVLLRREFAQVSDLRLYPALFGHLEDRAAWALDDVVTGRSVVATLLAEIDGAPVAHAALRTPDPGAPTQALELARVYVRETARRRGLAAALLGRLESVARERGERMLVLGTGPLQPEAIATYTRLGFSPMEPYPPYDRFSQPPLDVYGPALCFAKDL